MPNEFIPRLTAPNITIDYYRHTGYYRREVIGWEPIYDPNTGEIIDWEPIYEYFDGLNECLLINSENGDIMPNCVGYAWGRWYEINGIRPDLSRGDAQLWYGHTSDGYPRSKKGVNLGSICCFVGGNIGGHVGVVEQRISPNEYITSNSYYGSTYWTLEYLIYKNGLWRRYNYNSGKMIANYKCQGFINNPYINDDVVLPKESIVKYATRIL